MRTGPHVTNFRLNWTSERNRWRLVSFSDNLIIVSTVKVEWEDIHPWSIGRCFISLVSRITPYLLLRASSLPLTLHYHNICPASPPSPTLDLLHSIRRASHRIHRRLPRIREHRKPRRPTKQLQHPSKNRIYPKLASFFSTNPSLLPSFARKDGKRVSFGVDHLLPLTSEGRRRKEERRKGMEGRDSISHPSSLSFFSSLWQTGRKKIASEDPPFRSLRPMVATTASLQQQQPHQPLSLSSTPSPSSPKTSLGVRGKEGGDKLFCRANGTADSQSVQSVACWDRGKREGRRGEKLDCLYSTNPLSSFPTTQLQRTRRRYL